jgi:transmembrane sensor
MQSENKNIDDLMIDYFSGSISEINLQRLSELLKSNADFKMQFEEMQKLRAITFVPQIEARKATNYALLLEQIKEDVPTVSMSRSWISRFRRIAAIVILMVSVSVALFYISRDIISPSDTSICYETVAPIGSQTKIILPDSTVVWLNSGSSLKYSQAFGKKNREVALSGEGYFVVTKNKNKPFLVHTGFLNVRVTGTIFNVRAYYEDVNVSVDLIEGVVHVSLPGINNAGSIRLKPNDKLVFSKLTNKMIISETDSYRSGLWTTGKLCFVDATIEQISKDLERKFDVKIRIGNNQIKKELFSGSLNLNLSLKDILSYIDVDKKFKINQVGDTINISVK